MTYQKPPPTPPPYPPFSWGYVFSAHRRVLRSRTPESLQYIPPFIGAGIGFIFGFHPNTAMYGVKSAIRITGIATATGAAIGWFVGPYFRVAAHKSYKWITTVPPAIRHDFRFTHSPSIRQSYVEELTKKGKADVYIEEGIGWAYACPRGNKWIDFVHIHEAEKLLEGCKWVKEGYALGEPVKKQLAVEGKGDWEEFYDELEEAFYYCNQKTKECRWDWEHQTNIHRSKRIGEKMEGIE
eukprot:gb/GECH01012856.1/.p1 GENE.gb/GECH01012856.1/~~gb/GECH01012856.1/.p1  ORF type:complete len:239 (+),score=41.92 gb/GECH01012856.1/:1-717(+)